MENQPFEVHISYEKWWISIVMLVFGGVSFSFFFWWKKTSHVVSSHLQVTVEPGWVFLHGFKKHATGLVELQICLAVFCFRIVKRRVNSSLKTNKSTEKSMVERWHFLSKWSLFGRQCCFFRWVYFIRSSLYRKNESHWNLTSEISKDVYCCASSSVSVVDRTLPHSQAGAAELRVSLNKRQMLSDLHQISIQMSTFHCQSWKFEKWQQKLSLSR